MLFPEDGHVGSRANSFSGGAMGAEKFLPRVQVSLASQILGGGRSDSTATRQGGAGSLLPPRSLSLESCWSHCWVLMVA